MFRFYTPIILVQIFCLYLAYKRNEQQKWFWIIIFFPFIGSLIYLYDTFYSRKNLENLTEEVKSSLSNNYKIKKLEREIVFSDTVSKRIELADEYMRCDDYSKAAKLYESCLEGIYENDTELLMKLIRVNFYLENYEEVIKYGEEISEDKSFKNSDEKVAFAWAYYRQGNSERADSIFQELDVGFSNYNQRMEYAKYLKETGNDELASEKFQELIAEIDSMNNYERKLKRKVLRQIKNEYTKMNS